MNQNQTESKLPSVEQPTDEGLDETTCTLLSDLLPPAEIVEAAEKVRVWMETNGYRNWQLGGICDRRIASDRDEWRDVLSDLRYAYPEVVKTRPTTWPLHLRNTISIKAEAMLREYLENAEVRHGAKDADPN